MVKAAAGLVVLGTLCAGAALGIGIYKGITFVKQHTDDLDGAVKDAKEKAADKFAEGITKATEALEKSADALKEWVAKQGSCNDGFGSGFGDISASWNHTDAFGTSDDFGTSDGFGTSDDFGTSDSFGTSDDFDINDDFGIPEGETISDEEYEKLEKGEDLDAADTDLVSNDAAIDAVDSNADAVSVNPTDAIDDAGDSNADTAGVKPNDAVDDGDEDVCGGYGYFR